MSVDLHTTLFGVLSFLEYLGLSIFLFFSFVQIYIRITPHDEFDLISQNNVAASVAFAGALIGFSLPLASAIAHSLSFIDCLIWGVIALLVQVITFSLLRLMLKDVSNRISNNELASGILVAGCSLSFGILNAACMTY